MSGGFSPSGAVSYTQTGGLITICNVGQNSNSAACFDLTATSSFTMSGGTISLRQASTAAATPLDYQVLSSTSNITGGSLIVGASSTTTNFNFRIRGNAPGIFIDGNTNAKIATLVNNVSVFATTTIAPGSTLNLNGFTHTQAGTFLFNNGTIHGNAAGSRLYFAGKRGQQYGGSGVAGTITDPAVGGQVLIDEFRFRSATFDASGGVDGSHDEFIELYNNTNEPITVGASDGSAGWAVAMSLATAATVVTLATMPASTYIPARGHYLVAYSDTTVNPATVGYRLDGYAVPDLLYLDADIADNAGVALFRTAEAANFTAANRLDAAGFNSHAGATADMCREGAGLVSPGANDGEYAFLRKLTTGFPQDTGDNAADSPIRVRPGRASLTVLDKHLRPEYFPMVPDSPPSRAGVFNRTG
ncbi:MAG: hypothetical protein LC803_06810 [Acidobacteria bacterium]|nr:hypothetical protein [Acidobacteriota bacterium]